MSVLERLRDWVNSLPWTDQGYLREQAMTQHDNAVATHMRDGMTEQEAVYAAEADHPGLVDRYSAADDGWYDDLPDDWADDEADDDGHSR